MKPIAEETSPMGARQNALEAENATLRQLQAALEIAKAHYVDLYALAPAAYCTISAQGLILQANRAATALLAVTQPAPIDQPITQFIVDADLDLFERYRQRVVHSGQAQSCELRMVDADRRQFWAHLQSAVAQDADGALQLRILLTDITPRKQHAAPDDAGVSQTIDHSDLAESLLRAKIGHALRQPLSAIGIYAKVLKSHVAPAGQPLLTQIQLCLTALSELLAK